MLYVMGFVNSSFRYGSQYFKSSIGMDGFKLFEDYWPELILFAGILTWLSWRWLMKRISG